MFEIKELFEKGFHYGHRKLRSNPKMNEFVFCEKWGISIIDLCKTRLMFQTALDALSSCVKKGGKVLFVGTKHQAAEVVEFAAKNCGQFYINKRWLGGTITNNNSTVNLPLGKLSKMEKDQEAGYFDKFTKKEQLDFQKKKEKLLALFSGIRHMGGIPNILIVIDPKRETIAIREAKLWGIPVIALADTDTPEPNLIKYLVPGNDEGKGSIEFFLEKCCQVIIEAQKESVVNKEAAGTKESGATREFSKGSKGAGFGNQVLGSATADVNSKAVEVLSENSPIDAVNATDELLKNSNGPVLGELANDASSEAA